MSAQILLVDDEVNIRRMLGALLREEGLSVTEAANGNAALLMIKDVDPDVILLDLLMPPGPDDRRRQMFVIAAERLCVVRDLNPAVRFLIAVTPPDLPCAHSAVS